MSERGPSLSENCSYNSGGQSLLHCQNQNEKIRNGQEDMSVRAGEGLLSF